MKAMHDLDTEDVQWINVVGHLWRGKPTVFNGHTAIHKGMSAHDNCAVDTVEIHQLTPTVVVAIATMRFGESFAPGKFVKTRGSFTMMKRDTVWKIAQFQNTFIDPKAEHDDIPKWAATGFFPGGAPPR